MTASLPRVSVALCTWNGARWLRPQLDSILAQEDVRIEIVALDDASTDDSLAILREYAARDARIRVEANPVNLGHLASFENCMAMCEADFIAPADQDDLWQPRKLRRLLDALGEADLSYCDSAYINAEGHPIGGRLSTDLHMLEGRDPLPFVLHNSVSGHALLVRRAAFAAARPFPPGVFHDAWLASIAATRRGVVHLDETQVLFRRHEGSASRAGRTQSTPHLHPRAEREAAWFDTRATFAAALAARLPVEEARRINPWRDLLTRLSQGDARGVFSLCLRDRAALGGAFASIQRALSYALKARRIRRGRRSAAPEQPPR